MTKNAIWLDPEDISLDKDFIQAIGGSEFIAKILVRRGIDSIKEAVAFLDLDQYTPAKPTEIPDLGLAADRLELAIRNKEIIGIWGDFDADGQTATSLLVDGLKRLGAYVK